VGGVKGFFDDVIGPEKKIQEAISLFFFKTN